MNFIISHYGFTTRPCPRLPEVSTVLGLVWTRQALILRFIYNAILPDTGDVTLDRLLDTAHLCLHTIHINLGYQGQERGRDFDGSHIKLSRTEHSSQVIYEPLLLFPMELIQFHSIVNLLQYKSTSQCS